MPTTNGNANPTALSRLESLTAWLHNGHACEVVGEYTRRGDSRTVTIWERDGWPVIVVGHGDESGSFDIFVPAASSPEMGKTFRAADEHMLRLINE